MKTRFLFTILLTLLSKAIFACDGTSVTVVSNTDNGDGTYTLHLTVCFEPGDMMGYTDQLTLQVDAGNITSFSPQDLTFSDGTVLYGGQLNSSSIQWEVSGWDWVSSAAPDQCYDVTLVVDQNPEGYYANVGPNCIHSGVLPTPCVSPNEPSSTQNYTFCVGENIPDFTATGDNGNTINWYDSDQTTLLTTGSSATAASLNISSSSSSSFSFYLAQSNGNCESPLLPVTVTVEAAADASFSSFGPLCEGESPVTLSSLVTGTSGGDFTVNGVNQTSFDPASLGAGTYTVEYTAGTGSCVDIQNTSVTVNPSEDASWTNVGPFCEGETALTLATLVTGTTGGTFTVNGSVSVEFDPNALGVGSYTVEYSVGSGACADQQSNTVQVVSSADASFSSFGPLCEGESPVELANLVTGTGGGSFKVEGSSTTSFDPSVLGSGTFTVEYTVGTGACQDSYSTTVDVNASSDASWSDNGPYCTGDQNESLNSWLSGTPGGVWTVNGNLETDFSPLTLGEGSFSVEYSVGNGQCAQQLAQQVYVVAAADATVTSPGDLCLSGNTLDLNDFVQGDVGGLWSGTNVNGSTFDPTLFSSAQTTQVTYTVGTGTCQSTSTVDVNLVDAPDPTFTVFSACEGSHFELEHVGSVTSSTTFTWDFDGLNAYGQGTGVYDLGYPNEGTYNVTLSVADGACVSTVYSQTVEVYPQPELSVAVADESCFGACNGVVILTPTNGTFNNAPNYTWNTGLTVGTATNLCAGTYSVEVSDDNTCTNNYEFEVSSPEELVVNVTSQNVSCNGMNDGNAYVDVYGGTPEYYLTWSNGETTMDLNNLSAGSYSVEVEDAMGCTYSETFTLSEPSPVLNGEEVDVDPESLIVGTVTELSVADNFDSYSWFVVDENVSSESSFSTSFENAGNYPVFVVVEVAGCYDTLQTNVEVDELFAVYVPNAFTPGDVDGINDNFKPVVSVDNVEEYELRVFNRWGELVFETTDPYQAWDGTSQEGSLCQQDVYVYQLLVKGAVQEAYSTIGEVTLFR